MSASCCHPYATLEIEQKSNSLAKKEEGRAEMGFHFLENVA
jgi:hypothetical protein